MHDFVILHVLYFHSMTLVTGESDIRVSSPEVNSVSCDDEFYKSNLSLLQRNMEEVMQLVETGMCLVYFYMSTSQTFIVNCVTFLILFVLFGYATCVKSELLEPSVSVEHNVPAESTVSTDTTENLEPSVLVEHNVPVESTVSTDTKEVFTTARRNIVVSLPPTPKLITQTVLRYCVQKPSNNILYFFLIFKFVMLIYLKIHMANII